jgi:hypothetical protein
MKSKKELWKMPGLIVFSIFLPAAVGLFYVNYEYSQPRTLEVVWTTDKVGTWYNLNGLDRIKNKNHKHFDLKGNDTIDQQKLTEIKKEIEQLKSSKDSCTGVHVHFSPTTKYWTVVHTLNILEKLEHWAYIQHEDDIWVFNRPTTTYIVD